MGGEGALPSTSATVVLLAMEMCCQLMHALEVDVEMERDCVVSLWGRGLCRQPHIHLGRYIYIYI